MNLFLSAALGIAVFGACCLIQKIRNARKKAVTSGGVNYSHDWEDFRTSLEARLAKEARIEWLRCFAFKYTSEDRMEEAYSCLEEADGLARNEIVSPVRFSEIAC